MSFRQGLAAALLLGSTALPAWAVDYYVAPLGYFHKCSSDGSKLCPWPSVTAALGSGKISGGDTIWLMSGNHGALEISSNASFDYPVLISSEAHLGAIFEYIYVLNSSRGLTFKDIAVVGGGSRYNAIVYTAGTTSDLVFDGLEVRSTALVDDFLTWSAEKWVAIAKNAIWTHGPRTAIKNSKISFVRHGIMAHGVDSDVLNNTIHNFSGDGIRAFSGGTVFGNIVENSFKVDGNHDDGFQSFSINGTPVTNLVIDSNKFIEWSHSHEHPLRGLMQGIGMFDGYYDDLVIRNNLVVSSAYHGLTVDRARRAQIVNNTITSSSGLPSKYPWIRIAGDSSDTIVSNNVAMKFNSTLLPESVVFVDNKVILDPRISFVDPASYNFLPAEASGFLDVANPKYAPDSDILGLSRPSGMGPDLGAYEVGATGGTVTEEPATTETTTTDGAGATTESTTTTDTAGTTTGTTTEATTETTTTDESGTMTESTTTTDTSDTTTETTTTPGRSAGKWSKPLRKK